MWQDNLIFIINLIMLVSLVPQVIKGFRESKCEVSKYTGVLTTASLVSLSIIYATLYLPLSSFTSLLAGLLWFSITIQSFYYK